MPPLIDRALFFEAPETSGGQLSPDGRFISFLRPHEGVVQIWLKPRDQPMGTARPVSAGGTRPVSSTVWTADSQRILYLQEQAGGGVHLLVVDVIGSSVPAGPFAPRDLTPLGNVRAQILAVPEATPGHVVVAINQRDPKASDVYRVEITTGQRQLLFTNDVGVVDWTTDLTGKLRLGQRPNADGGNEILKVDGRRLTQVYSCGPGEICAPLRFHKDGRRVFMVTNQGRADLSRLVLFDLATRLSEGVDTDPAEASDFGGADFSEATSDLVATTYEGDRLHTYPHDKRYLRAYETVHAAVPDGDVRFVSSSKDARYRLASIVSDLDPGATYLYDETTGRVDLVYRPWPHLPIQNLSAMRSVTYDSRDGNTVHAYLTVPKGSSFRDMPAIVLPHGGPWSRDIWGYDPEVQFLANRGYLVLQPNYRGSSGFGKRFLNLGNKQWGTGTMQHDLTDGALWLAEQRFADPKRIAIMGTSYGGFAALAGLAFEPPIWAAGVDLFGPASVLAWLESSPLGDGPRKKVCGLRVGDPSDPAQLAVLASQSPLRAVRNITAPLLLAQGNSEPGATRAESDQVVAAVRAGGHAVEYLVAPDPGRGPVDPQDRVAVFAAVERFLARHLGGRQQQALPPATAQRLGAMTIDPRNVNAAGPRTGPAASGN